MSCFMALILICLAQVGAVDPAIQNNEATILSCSSPEPIDMNCAETRAPEWSDPLLLRTFPAWDYWWLNTRICVDSTGTVHAVTSMHNYTTTNYNFYRDILDVTGDHISQESEWNGYNNMPAFMDGNGINQYVNHPVIGMLGHQDTGRTDPDNYMYITQADVYGDIYFTRLDPSGNYINYNYPACVGTLADAWAGENQLVLNSQGDIFIAWSRATHEILYIKSTDKGLNWSAPIVIASDMTNQTTKTKMLIDDEDCLHFIWQHWNGTYVALEYKKLNPDETVCVDTTPLTFGTAGDAWSPHFAIDSRRRIHIVWCTHYEGSQSMYHTVIDGTLDKGGNPSTDAEITLVQEYPFITDSAKKRHPKIAIDSFDHIHVVYDRGPYGCVTNKKLYYTRRSSDLAADSATLSEAAGGSIDFLLGAGEANADRKYILVGGTSGSTPGMPLPGGLVTLPVNWDLFSDIEMMLLNTPVFAEFLGMLDGRGFATAQMSVPPLPPGTSGLIMTFAYCCNNPFDFVSEPITIEIVD